MSNPQIQQSVIQRIKNDKCGPTWRYIQHNQAALAKLEKDIFERAIGSVTNPNRLCGTITYSELFRGLMVDVSVSGSGATTVFPQTEYWRDADGPTAYGVMVEQFLRAISMCSVARWDFMLSVCVVHAGPHGPRNVPDGEFFDLAKDLQVIPSNSSRTPFLVDEKKAVLQHFVNHGFTPATSMLFPWSCP
ncbi:hypothetical protein EON80_14450 [bacterium]|nr:MAG: hypothetical protein EON80_14450 [bacterium]